MKKRAVIERVVNLAAYTFCLCAVVVGTWICLKVFVYDTFPVNTNSMEPSILPGDVIMVNKLIAGARIYKKFDFDEGAELEAFRVKGIRRVARNDVVVFNYPQKGQNRLRFVINSVFVKRCAAIPGDTISIENGIYRNHSIRDTIGILTLQRELGADSLSPVILRAYPHNNLFGWTVKNFGPFYVPRAGDVIPMNRQTLILYRKNIEYETGAKLEWRKGRVFMNGSPVESYRFEKNYYFFCGDKVGNSQDSRYFGLVPEEFIVGVVPKVLYSRTPGSRDRILKNL